MSDDQPQTVEELLAREQRRLGDRPCEELSSTVLRNDAVGVRVPVVLYEPEPYKDGPNLRTVRLATPGISVIVKTWSEKKEEAA